MAGELTPEQVRDGGTGSVSTGNIRAPDYRSAQAPEQVNTDLPNNQAGARAAALGSVFREFEGISGDIYNKAQTQAGALAGAASGATGHPEYRQGLQRFTAYSQAFNNAATGAYAIEAEAQADDAAARLRVQANNNPDTFRATFTAVRDGVLKNAPPQALPMLTELYNKHLAQGLAAISGDQASEQRQLQRQTWDVGVSRQAGRVAELQGSPNPNDQLAAADEQVKLGLMIEGGKNAGLYSEAEAQSMHVTSMRKITQQVFQTQVDRELANPNGDVITLLERFRQAHIDNLSNPNEAPILGEDEFQQLYAGAITKTREWNLTQQMLKRQGKSAEDIKYEDGDKQYTSMLLQGTLTDRSLNAAVKGGDLKPERATALHTLLNGGQGPTKSNAAAYARVTNDPNFLDMSGEEIAGLSDISMTDKLGLVKEQERRRANWEGTQNVKQARSSISAALKILPGTPAAALSDEQRRSLTDANQEFTQIMNDADPAKRDSFAGTAAQTVIKHAQQRDRDDQVQGLTTQRQSAIKNHGPGTASEWSDEKLKAYLKQKDDAIATLRAQSKD